MTRNKHPLRLADNMHDFNRGVHTIRDMIYQATYTSALMSYSWHAYWLLCVLLLYVFICIVSLSSCGLKNS